MKNKNTSLVSNTVIGSQDSGSCSRNIYIYIYIYIYSLIFLASAFVGVGIYSFSTSPLYEGYGYDSAMFQTIGKYWGKGVLPYVGLYDHKGPVIFFINMLGYMLCGRYGVFLLQAVCVALTEVFLFKILERRFNRSFSLVTAALLPLFMAVNWQEGNTTEEYILPLLAASFLCMSRWCDEVGRGAYDHKPRWAFIYGLCFAFALMSRVTNALGLCMGIAFITVTLVLTGRWRNLLKNMLAFLAGTALIVVPFCVYFAYHDALYDMWYGTILYNMSYFSSSGSSAPSGLVDLLVDIRRYLPGWCLVAASALHLLTVKKDRLRAALWLCMSLVNTLFMYTLNEYAHYGICLLPFLYIAMTLLWKASGRKCARRLSALLLAGMLMAVTASSVLKTYKNLTVTVTPQEYEDIVDYGDNYGDMIELIAPEDRDSFVAFNCMRSLYLEYDICPAFRFFVLQSWMMENSPDIRQEIYTEFADSQVEWVLSFEPNGANEEIRQLLGEKYRLIAETEHGAYRLYNLC